MALAVPLLKDTVIGALVVRDTTGRVFSEEQIRLAQAFAVHAAVALENIRLHGETVRRVADQAALLRLSQAVLLAPGTHEVLDASVGVTAKVFGVDLCGVLLPDEEEGQTLRLVAGVGWNPGVVGTMRVETGLQEAAPLPPVAGDPSELREALTNLVFNALDAMPDGGQVTLKTGVEGERVWCVVADTGIGMSEEVRRRVFDPFFTTKGEKGNGLGLSVVYGIITRHGGEIEVQSQEGCGSAFTIRLPVAQEIPTVEEKTPPLPPPRSAKILVIDDEPEVREVLEELLASQGHAVVACANGRSGLTALEEGRFDLLITDLAMPEVTGWQVASAVKLWHPETPVALLTGYGDRMDPEEARAKGVDFLLSKPFGLEDVEATVAQALWCRIEKG